MQPIKNSWFLKSKSGLSFLMGAIIIFALYVSFKGFGISNESGKILDDAINKTNISLSENKEYVKIEKEILELMKNEIAKDYSYCFEAEKVNLLGSSIFINKDLMQKNKELLNSCIKQYEKYDEQYSKMMKQVEGVIYSSNLMDAQKKEEVDAFNKTSNNSEKNRLSAVRIKELINNYKLGINLYDFFLDNIGNYELSNNNIIFTPPDLVDRYNERVGLINLSDERLKKANDELTQYTQKILEESGVKTNINDINKYMQNK